MSMHIEIKTETGAASCVLSRIHHPLLVLALTGLLMALGFFATPFALSDTGSVPSFDVMYFCLCFFLLSLRNVVINMLFLTSDNDFFL